MTSQSTLAQQCKDSAWNTQPANGILANYAAPGECFSAHAQEKRQRLTTDGSDKRMIGNHAGSFHIYFGQFQSLIFWILIAAGVILALLGGSVDVIAVVLLNAIIVFFQDFNGEKLQRCIIKDDHPTQHAATLNPLIGSSSELRLIGQQPAE